MMKRSSLFTTAALGVALLAAPLHAQDSATLDHNYIALKATLGIGGSRSLESDAVTVGPVNVNISDSIGSTSKLQVSYGLTGQYMVPLHRFFVLGGLLGVMSWKSTAASNDADRNLAFDLDVVPQGRLPLTNAFELYLSLPVGLTLDAWNEVESSATVGMLASYKVESDTAVGFNISLLAGARYALTESFGVFTEIGFTHRQFAHEVTLSATAVGLNLGSAKANADLTLDQFAWNIGAFF